MQLIRQTKPSNSTWCLLAMIKCNECTSYIFPFFPSALCKAHLDHCVNLIEWKSIALHEIWISEQTGIPWQVTLGRLSKMPLGQDVPVRGANKIIDPVSSGQVWPSVRNMPFWSEVLHQVGQKMLQGVNFCFPFGCMNKMHKWRHFLEVKS